MKYKNIDEMDRRIENIVRRKVKHYYTDWKNYDRPKYMKCKGSNDPDAKKLILIARDSGTYLIFANSAKDKETAAGAIYDYFSKYESADFYDIDINNLTVNKHAK